MTQRITEVPDDERTVPEPEAADLQPDEGRQRTFNARLHRPHNDG
ncbi:DUF2635 domain-containing protein, partial [Pseudomonas syringae pv. tagetis]